MTLSVSNTSATAQSTGLAQWQQNQQNFKSLFSALKGGDLAAAQQAYAALTAGSSTSTTSANPNSPLAQIGQALKNGDLAGAQKAAQQLQAGRGGHHHHADSTQAAAAVASPTPTSTSNSVNGALVNLIA